MVKAQFTIPEEMLWDLRKISCEKRTKITNVVLEAFREYIDKNRALLEQKIVIQ